MNVRNSHANLTGGTLACKCNLHLRLGRAKRDRRRRRVSEPDSIAPAGSCGIEEATHRARCFDRAVITPPGLQRSAVTSASESATKTGTTGIRARRRFAVPVRWALQKQTVFIVTNVDQV